MCLGKENGGKMLFHGLGPVLTVKIRARVTLGLLLPNLYTKLCIRVASKPNPKVRGGS